MKIVGVNDSPKSSDFLNAILVSGSLVVSFQINKIVSPKEIASGSLPKAICSLVNVVSGIEDFVKYNKCSSIYTATFNAHYAMFFGDYVFTAQNNNFPNQLKKLGYDTRSYFNGVLLIHYNLREEVEENEQNKWHFCDDFVDALGADLVFDWKKSLMYNSERRKKIFFSGSADDEDFGMPNKWRKYLKNNSNKDEL